MLTAQSLIAKAVIALVGKAVVAIAKLTFDKRKRACRALTKLFYAVQSLDETTSRVLGAISSQGQRGTAQDLIAALVPK